MPTELSNSQREAIKKFSGPCIILAGAGTGKTHTIVEKIKFLVKNKIFRPDKIVCLTFSNEAVNSLITRVKKELNLDINEEVVIKTFHAFSSILLKKHGRKINSNENFEILEPDEAKIMLHEKLKVSPSECHKYINIIGKAKDLGISIETLDNYAKEKEIPNCQELKEKLETIQIKLNSAELKNKIDRKTEIELFKKIKRDLELIKFVNAWKAYEKIKSKENYKDYSDLNTGALILLNKFPEIAKEYDYFIIDEFQDTNKIQLDLLFKLAYRNAITVVGDLNQSIYRFRGAYKENFSLFIKHFQVKEKDIFTLNKSYRSPNKVLKIAHQLISRNYANPKECFKVENVNSVEGKKVELFELKNSLEEARKIVEIIEEEIKKGAKPEEICVIFRTHKQGEIIKKALDLKLIPYASANKKNLLIYGPIKLVIDCLSILNKIIKKEKGGLQEWWDLFYRTKFPEADLIEIGKLIKESNSENLSIEILTNLENLNLSTAGKIKAKEIEEKIKFLLPNANNETPKLIEEIYKTLGFFDESNKKEIPNLNKFYELALNFSKKNNSEIESFLNYLQILLRLNLQVDSVDMDKKGVRLMTAHATKGLEYKIVIITNLAEKRFPIESSNNFSLLPFEIYPDIKDYLKYLDEKQRAQFIKDYEKENQLFEERRLFYVAITRTKEKLFLTFAQEYSSNKHEPSIFLHEIDYKNNSNISITEDAEEKFIELEKNNKKISELTEILPNTFIPTQEKPKIEDEKVFSPSALLTFKDCQKKFEYKYVYNMPEKIIEDWESIKIGSLVHLVLEKGVKNKFKTLKEFADLAIEIHSQSEWQSIDISEIISLIRIFFERNKNKFDENSLTEQVLRMNIEGLQFIGIADRIDFAPEGIEIIDYKTGKTNPPVLSRNLQLGYYALSAEKFGKVKKLTLDLLKEDKPLELELDENGNAIEVHSKRFYFNIHETKKELIKTTKQIINAFKSVFLPCSLEKNCEFCNEYFYNKMSDNPD